MRVRLTRIDPDLPLPAYATDGAAALDLYCRRDVVVEPGALGFIPANVIAAVPAGHVLLVALRSGTPRRTGLSAPMASGSSTGTTADRRMRSRFRYSIRRRRP